MTGRLGRGRLIDGSARVLAAHRVIGLCRVLLSLVPGASSVWHVLDHTNVIRLSGHYNHSAAHRRRQLVETARTALIGAATRWPDKADKVSLTIL